MTKYFQKEYLLVLVILILSILIRSIHYEEYVNFSSDQASFAMESYEIWQNKEFRLIGPSISYKTLGRELFQGSITYYFQLLFLLPAQFEPIIASYLFMVFASGMIIPLYFGAKKLINMQAAIVMVSIYAFVPYYIDYTRFLWNPTFQLALTPLIILLMGYHHEKKSSPFLFLIGLLSGMLLLFHYQFIVILIGMLIYYSVFYKEKFLNLILLSFGIIVGFSPMIVFELRNQFYNTQTFMLYLANFSSVAGNNPIGGMSPHYFLSIMIFMALIVLKFIQKNLTTKVGVLFAFIVACAACATYIPRPTSAFGMANNWNILYEKKAAQIIKNTHPSEFNVINLGYDTVAVVQKYLLKTGGVDFDSDNYSTNQYLYVITRDIDYMNDPAYEINTFKPSEIVDEWQLNSTYKLILLKRVSMN